MATDPTQVPASAPANAEGVPATFTTREWGNETVYACDVLMSPGHTCPFDTLDLLAAKQHAIYGHFAAVEPGGEQVFPTAGQVSASSQPAITTESATGLSSPVVSAAAPVTPDQSKAATGNAVSDQPVEGTAPAPAPGS